MTVSLTTPLNQIRLAPGSAIALSGLTWQHYQALLQDLGDDRSTRIAYNEGVLEIRLPSKPHEIINRLLAKIIFTLAEALGMDINELGSTTFNREDLDKGIEPDSCFYIQNANVVQGFNPEIPHRLPPDLAVEVDISNSSEKKMVIYQALGIPELWVYRRGKVAFRILQEQHYVETSESQVFPRINQQQLNQWIQLRETGSDVTVVRAVRQFCQQLSS